MNLFNNKIKAPAPANDRAARFIAGQIIRWQIQASNRLNHWINGYPRKKQRLILILSGVLATGALLISLLPGRWQPPLPAKGNYIPRHIGQASEMMMPKGPTRKTTDSTTNKQ